MLTEWGLFLDQAHSDRHVTTITGMLAEWWGTAKPFAHVRPPQNARFVKVNLP